MSRQTKFTLKFPKGGLSLKVSLQKAYEAKTSFRQTFVDADGVNRTVRTIKVLVQEDNKPKSLEELDQIVPWGQVEKSYPYRDEDGRERLLPIDTKVTGKLYSKSDVMSIVGFLDASSVSPRMYDGNHYFLKIQADSKTKETHRVDRQAYTLIHYIISEYNKLILVKFVSGDREKFAIIYREGGGLMLSTVLHETYQREAPETEREKLTDAKKYAEKLIATFSIRGLDPAELQDNYELMLQNYIEEERERIRSGVRTKARPKPKSPVTLEEDFFAQIESLT